MTTKQNVNDFGEPVKAAFGNLVKAGKRGSRSMMKFDVGAPPEDGRLEFAL